MEKVKAADDFVAVQLGRGGRWELPEICQR
jgi:hypothetical protein